jgi:hypothetical protein
VDMSDAAQLGVLGHGVETEFIITKEMLGI